MQRQSCSTKDEIKRQLDLLWNERWGRLPLTALALALTTIYLPVWVAALCAIIDIGAELIGMRYMRALDARRHPARYNFVMMCVFLMEFSYALPAALIWQLDENNAKAFAVGMIMATLLQLTSARSIHLPFGFAGFAGVALPVLLGNSVYWIGINHPVGLILSTAAASGGLAYTMIAMVSNNRLHSTAAQDRKAAQDGDRAKTRFLAQMSHELRTPLNAILGMGHAELRRNKDALSQNRLSVLIASAEGLSTILDDILDLSAVQEGRLPIRPKPAIPREEILASLGLFQPGIEKAGLLLKSNIAPTLGEIAMIDTQRLRQCLSNLMSNAIKHTKEGEIRVTASLEKQSHVPEPLLRIQVEDTGPGIPANLHRSVFEPFSQYREHGNGQESNGLGLSICRAMARQMGGDLILMANEDAVNPGQGACFVLTIALGVAPEGATAERPLVLTSPVPEERKSLTAAARSVTSGLRVLVVDDIATNRLVASTYLRMLGASTIEASSGDAALRILQSEVPDLVLLDMNMPGLSGLQTLQQIHTLKGASGQVPVIAMTADTLDQNLEIYRESGLDGYLAKPLNPARIEAEIRAVLENAQSRQPK